MASQQFLHLFDIPTQHVKLERTSFLSELTSTFRLENTQDGDYRWTARIDTKEILFYE